MYMNGLKRKVCVAVLCVFAAAAVLYAHTPLLTVEDNGDGTIFVQGGFSNGASAGGVKLYLKDAATGEKLYDGVFPDIGETNLDIPSVPYTVTFDAGPGHIVVKDGPPPPGGFGAAKADKAVKSDAAETDSSGSAAVSSGKGTNSAAPSSAAAVDWTPADTASVMPNAGVSYVSLIAMIMSCINTVLLLFVLRKRR